MNKVITLMCWVCSAVNLLAATSATSKFSSIMFSIATVLWFISGLIWVFAPKSSS